MSLDIREQNSSEKIELLIAQRQYYADAKRMRIVRMFGAIGLTALAPIILIFWPDSKPFMAVIGGIWLIISWAILEGIEAKRIKKAAIIQEQFDCGLFKLPWNQILVGDRLSPELISEANRRFKGRKEDLMDWYADTGKIPYPLNILLCQRSNVVWDWRLRRNYGWAILSITVIIFISGIIFASILNESLPDYLLGIFIPSLSAYLQGMKVFREHLQTATEKEQLEKTISEIWDSGLKKTKSVTLVQCRAIQDRIFSLRSKGPVVPDKWYTWLKDKYEVDMKQAIENFKREAEKKFSNGI